MDPICAQNHTFFPPTIPKTPQQTNYQGGGGTKIEVNLYVRTMPRIRSCVRILRRRRHTATISNAGHDILRLPRKKSTENCIFSTLPKAITMKHLPKTQKNHQSRRCYHSDPRAPRVTRFSRSRTLISDIFFTTRRANYDDTDPLDTPIRLRTSIIEIITKNAPWRVHTNRTPARNMCFFPTSHLGGANTL